jgi:hypothetical protein
VNKPPPPVNSRFPGSITSDGMVKPDAINLDVSISGADFVYPNSSPQSNPLPSQPENEAVHK